jgi:hypothetical protein
MTISVMMFSAKDRARAVCDKIAAEQASNAAPAVKEAVAEVAKALRELSEKERGVGQGMPVSLRTS